LNESTSFIPGGRTFFLDTFFLLQKLSHLYKATMNKPYSAPRSKGLVALAAFSLLSLSACSNNMDPSHRALAGGLIGAGIGAGIGSSGGTGAAAGAGIGAATGMLAGLLWE
jgi:hypothetical protein